MNEQLLVVVGIIALLAVAAFARRSATSSDDEGDPIWRSVARRLGLQPRPSRQLEFAELTGVVDQRRLLGWMESHPDDESSRIVYTELELLSDCWRGFVLRSTGATVDDHLHDESARPVDIEQLGEEFEIVGELTDEARTALSDREVGRRLVELTEEGVDIAIEAGRLEMQRRYRDRPEDPDAATDRTIRFFETTLEVAGLLDDAVAGRARATKA